MWLEVPLTAVAGKVGVGTAGLSAAWEVGLAAPPGVSLATARGTQRWGGGCLPRAGKPSGHRAEGSSPSPPFLSCQPREADCAGRRRDQEPRPSSALHMHHRVRLGDTVTPLASGHQGPHLAQCCQSVGLERTWKHKRTVLAIISNILTTLILNINNLTTKTFIINKCWLECRSK